MTTKYPQRYRLDGWHDRPWQHPESTCQPEVRTIRKEQFKTNISMRNYCSPIFK